MLADATQAAAHATWYGNLHELIGYPWILFILVPAATLCGLVIGRERRARRKPVGMRTVTLICIGSAVFTMVSIFMAQADDADPGRIAAQVVTGIGFLGAGTILHTKGRVKGLTTAATIWVVAAIGMLIGAGYAVPGVAMTLLVFGLLQLHSESEDGARQPPSGETHGPPAGPEA